MKCLTFAIGLFAFGFAAATPARADFAVVQFGGGHCQIWWYSSDNPWGNMEKDRGRFAGLVGRFDRAR